MRLQRQRRRNATMSTEQVFTEIYEAGGWGGHGDFDSGSGTRSLSAIEPYLDAVVAAAKEHGFYGGRAIDLGCGDFTVGSKLAPHFSHYTGVDVVAPLIERNTRLFGGSDVEFLKADAIKDEIPDADCCLIRQVLQHLSNEQILRILDRLTKYEWVVVTEHEPPEPPRFPNVDKAHGGDVRIYDRSAVILTAAPFNIPAAQLSLLVQVPAPEGGPPGVLRTYLLHNP
jgi:hypothetical protein